MLWGGLPVVTLPSEKMSARIGSSIALASRCGFFVARNIDDYEHLALRIVRARSDIRPSTDSKRMTGGIKLLALILGTSRGPIPPHRFCLIVTLFNGLLLPSTGSVRLTEPGLLRKAPSTSHHNLQTWQGGRVWSTRPVRECTSLLPTWQRDTESRHLNILYLKVNFVSSIQSCTLDNLI
jgi:hypothetical protein